MAKKDNAHTLVEVIVILVILGALSYIAIPRMQNSLIYRKKADAAARKIVTDLRRARHLAITDAAANTDGFALNRSGSDFEIEDLSDSSTVQNSEFSLAPNISCSGGTSFQFGPLGNLKTGSDTQLVISSSGKIFTINIIPATGIVKCTEN